MHDATTTPPIANTQSHTYQTENAAHANKTYWVWVSNRWVGVYVGGASGIHLFVRWFELGLGINLDIYPYPFIFDISNGENGSLALHNPSEFD